jgi:hypothetical protein
MVRVYVDCALAACQPVDTTDGPASFARTVNVAQGEHSIRVDWEHDGEILATKLVSGLQA